MKGASDAFIAATCKSEKFSRRCVTRLLGEKKYGPVARVPLPLLFIHGPCHPAVKLDYKLDPSSYSSPSLPPPPPRKEENGAEHLETAVIYPRSEMQPLTCGCFGGLQQLAIEESSVKLMIECLADADNDY